MFPFEEQIIRGVFEIVSQSSFLKPVVFFLSVIAPWIIGIWFLFFLSRVGSFKLKFYYFALAVLGIIISRGIIAEIAYKFFYFPRPFEFFDMASVIPRAIIGGMPSGYMTALIPIALVFILINKKFGAFFASIVIFIGIAMMIGGAYWISDILAGIVIGVIGFLIAKIILPKKSAIGYIEPVKIDKPKLLV